MAGTAEMRHTAPKSERAPWYVTALRALGVLVALGALAVFFYYAFRLTLTPVQDNGQAGGNLKPGDSLRFYLERPTREALMQVGGNVLLLAPLGVLLPWISLRLRGFLRITVVVALLSLAIETVQGLLVMGRAFDIDDVILNTAGAALAYLLVGRKVSRMMRGRRR